ncbi:MAG TPA: D-alanyl-D-alanine carboxypeptidase [Thermoleophilaceae bacterium]|nr:D-alanyl-D-alanine carboxypeptidase [Thermoleophilaceae bacterium]
MRPLSKLAVPLLGMAAAALPAAPAAASPEADAALGRALSAQMRFAGPSSGAFVVNATENRTVLRWRHHTGRVLASNVKLFTTAAALARFGTEGRLGTEVRGAGQLETDGTWTGDLYLRGGGDPSFGSARFVRRAYGSGATVEALAAEVEEAGIERVSGRIYGDESRFDSRRGGPASGYGTSIWVGPLSAMSFNRGLASERGLSFQRNPASFAAARLDAALERRGVRVARAPRARTTPGGATLMASVESPTMARLAQLTNKPSDNFFAEMLLKGLGLQATGRGTTARGARVAMAFARGLGSGARLVDGSGLSYSNRATPFRVTRLLTALLERDEFEVFDASLSVAGRDGTLAPRMRRGPARGRCHGKTGTLTSVSALSGYCRARSGDLYAFSILMNGVSISGARRLQDRMAQAMAGVRG